MKKILFMFVSFATIACSYTVQNDYMETIKVGEELVESGHCIEQWNFGLEEILITKEDEEKLNKSNDETYDSTHYIVAKDGTIKKADIACDAESATLEDMEEEGQEEDESENKNEMTTSTVPAATSTVPATSVVPAATSAVSAASGILKTAESSPKASSVAPAKTK